MLDPDVNLNHHEYLVICALSLSHFLKMSWKFLHKFPSYFANKQTNLNYEVPTLHFIWSKIRSKFFILNP